MLLTTTLCWLFPVIVIAQSLWGAAALAHGFVKKCLHDSRNYQWEFWELWESESTGWEQHDDHCYTNNAFYLHSTSKSITVLASGTIPLTASLCTGGGHWGSTERFRDFQGSEGRAPTWLGSLDVVWASWLCGRFQKTGRGWANPSQMFIKISLL